MGIWVRKVYAYDSRSKTKSTLCEVYEQPLRNWLWSQFVETVSWRVVPTWAWRPLDRVHQRLTRGDTGDAGWLPLSAQSDIWAFNADHRNERVLVSVTAPDDWDPAP